MANAKLYKLLQQAKEKVKEYHKNYDNSNEKREFHTADPGYISTRLKTLLGYMELNCENNI